MAEIKTKSKDFLTADRFLDYLKATGIYKELWKSKEGIISAVLAVFTMLFLGFIFTSIPKYNPTEDLLNILGIIVGGAFGLLGFLVGGMALIVGSISDDILDIIDSGEKFPALLSIVFRFYYDGAIIGLLILVSLVSYFMLMIPMPYSKLLVYFFGFINSYLFIYTLLLSVMLLGASIRLMVLRHTLVKTRQK